MSKLRIYFAIHGALALSLGLIFFLNPVAVVSFLNFIPSLFHSPDVVSFDLEPFWLVFASSFFILRSALCFWIGAKPSQSSYIVLLSLMNLSAVFQSFYFWNAQGRTFPLLVSGTFWSLWLVADIVFYGVARLKKSHQKITQKRNIESEPRAL